MSELKIYHCDEWHNPYTEFYLKSEADKVIAEKDAIIEEQTKEIKFMHQHCKHGEHCGTSCAQIHGELTQATIEIAELKKEKEYTVEQTTDVINGQERELRRQKYKLCMAMADKCVDLCHKAKDLYRWAEDENLEHHYNHKIEFFARWHKRWLAIAEKFKTNSTAQ